MRPRQLKISNLRSWRKPSDGDAHIIDFTNLSFFAIVGPTGAGKSSILEALVFALYDATTWDQRGTKDLITKGADDMTVALDFEAQGHTYRVTRKIYANTRPALHRLECLTDPTREKFLLEGTVSAEIRKLIGLDYSTFISAVVLPQGAFAKLLKATPTEQSRILQEIMQLDRIAVLREKAQEQLNAIGTKVQVLRTRRERYSEDPEAELKQAQSTLAAADSQLQSLKQDQGAIDKHRDEIKTLDRETKDKEKAINSLPEIGSIISALKALLPASTEFEKRKSAALEQLATARAMFEKVERERHEADAKGLGYRHALDATTGLETLLRLHAEILEDEEELAARRADLRARQKEKGDLERALTSHEKALEVAGQRQRAAEEELQKATLSLEDCLGLLEAIRGSEKEQVKATQLQTKRQKLALAAAAALAKAENDLALAQERCKGAADALAVAENAQGAAKLGAHLHAGDPCPVCQQPIPKGFRTIAAPNLERALKQYKKARGELDTAIEELAAAKSLRRSAERENEEAKTEVEQCGAEVRKLASRAAKDLGIRQLAADDTALSSPFRKRKTNAEALLKIANEEARTLGLEVRSTRTKLDAEEHQLAKDEAVVKKAEVKKAAKQRQFETTRSALPSTMIIAENPQRGAIERARVRAEALREAAKAREDLERNAASKVREAEAAAQSLDEERAAKFDRPRRAEQRRAAVFAAALTGAAKLVNLKLEPVVLAQTDTLASDLDCANKLGQQAERTKGRLQAVIREEAERCTDLRQKEAALIKRSGCSSYEELSDRVEQIVGASHAARRQVTDLTQAIPIAKDLSARISAGVGLQQVFDDLQLRLANNAFLNYVMHQKQSALLSIASDIFGGMSGSQYGFSESFNIVDRLSGQERPVDTLSGGETFLASLALALALVELTGRSRGFLEVFFMDEGFGNLDPDTTERALDELERHARSGRLVGVISHVPAVAERGDMILRVTNGVKGSALEVLDAAAREQFIEEDLERTLTPTRA